MGLVGVDIREDRMPCEIYEKLRLMLGVLDLVVTSIEPLESDIGRLRVEKLAKKRAR